MGYSSAPLSLIVLLLQAGEDLAGTKASSWQDKEENAVDTDSASDTYVCCLVDRRFGNWWIQTEVRVFDITAVDCRNLGRKSS